MPSNTPIYSPCVGQILAATDMKDAGRTITLRCGGQDIQFMHLASYNKFKGDKVEIGVVIGLSGGEVTSYVKNYSSGPHIHIQAKENGVLQKLTTNGVNIDIGGTKNTTPVKSITVYQTHYDLLSSQTDASPCTGASGKNICKLHEKGINVIALTSDQRKKMGIKWGDKVQIVGKGFNVVAQVEDEMNIRFRTRCIKKQGLCIKADWATPKGKEGLSGPVTITKI